VQRHRGGVLLRGTASEGEEAGDEAEGASAARVAGNSLSGDEQEAAAEGEASGVLLRAATVVAAALAADPVFEDEDDGGGGGGAQRAPRAPRDVAAQRAAKQLLAQQFRELHSKRAAALAEAIGRFPGGRITGHPRHSHRRAGGFTLKRRAAEVEDEGTASAWRSDSHVADRRFPASLASPPDSAAAAPAAASRTSAAAAKAPGSGAGADNSAPIGSSASTSTVASSGSRSTAADR
jgi:hypothetical protein